MSEKKVSIISPCFNGKDHLDRFFSSLLNQTYFNVEFIFINDGSTDDTEKIFNKYKTKLLEKGWDVKYIYQNNKGQAAALNKGLKIITGEYLIFPDSDDILYPEHIQEKVHFMEENTDFGIAYCILDDCYLENVDKIIQERKRIPDNNMFKHILKKEHEFILWPPIGNIIRMSALLDVLPSLEIPECKGGQNYQIQMPILYKYPCGFINKHLGKYVIRQNSHSRTEQKKKLKRLLSVTKIRLSTVFILRYASLIEKFCLATYIVKILIKDLRKTIFHKN